RGVLVSRYVVAGSVDLVQLRPQVVDPPGELFRRNAGGRLLLDEATGDGAVNLCQAHAGGGMSHDVPRWEIRRAANQLGVQINWPPRRNADIAASEPLSPAVADPSRERSRLTRFSRVGPLPIVPMHVTSPHRKSCHRLVHVP